MKTTVAITAITALLIAPALASAEDAPPPYECDDRFGQCGTPEQSGGGCGCGCGGSILVNNTDLGDTYQYADDYDDDGIEDPYDNCPFARNPDQSDSDGDTFGDACDNCVDVGNEDQSDLDGDGEGDTCDADDDDDGLDDGDDICPTRADPEQIDTDSDGEGDACDADDDDDGHFDLDDNCPLIHNIDQEMPEDSESCYADDDGDGFYNSRDNCPSVHQIDQEDADGDGVGDECDGDQDDDMVPNSLDNCPLVPNTDQIDADRDGLGDSDEGSCDPGFCYVVMGDHENCLDPEANFTVYTPSLAEVRTGEDIRLRLFANREGGVPVEYRWTIEEAPAGSAATVANPYGSVSYATPFEFRYAEDNEATFTPDQPGEYVIRLVATQVWEDQYSGQLGETSEALAFILVEGEPTAAGGCSVATGHSRTGLAALLGLLGLIGLGRLRRRR